MVDKLKSLLAFLRVTDEQGKLSITNIVLVAVLIRLLRCEQLAIEDIAAFAATVAGYQFKRYVAGTPTTDEDERKAMQEAIASLQTKVTAIQTGQTLRR